LLLSLEDFDTEPPANVDDTDIGEMTPDPVASKPSTTFTQTSIQIALLKCFAIRLQVVKFANNIRGEPSYDDVLRVGSALSKELKENTMFISRVNQTRETAKKISQLRQNLFDLAIRRFLLLVHRPFAAKGLTDPHYYFSRKVCLDTAVTMLRYPCTDYSSPETANIDGTRDDYTQMKTICGGFFKSIIVHVSMVIFAELLTQIDEDTTASEHSKAAREPLKQCLRDVITLSANRVAEVENNIKGNLFMSLILAQLEAIEEGVDPAQRVLDAATKSADKCYEFLSTRFAAMNVQVQAPENGLDDLLGFGGAQDFGIDFTMQDWSLDQDSNQDAWFKSGFEDGAWWHL
jgi:hypothetical protein